ncbi:MAG: hypothetical protein J6B55_04035 [Clostridia bacterium]|nr:hypothetical protein [Clostridia bacterium]
MKRITLFAGHYGSGKTNIAVNYAKFLREQGNDVVIADLDIVNPYFRTKDSQADLEAAGIRLISSKYANSNVDLPALPSEIYGIFEDKSSLAVLDVGGDDRGALALGRYTPLIKAEGDYEMLLVINRYRPLTRTADDCIEIMHEVEAAGGLKFTGLVNNSNLGAETVAQDILDSVDYAKEVSEKTGLPVRMTAVEKDLATELKGKIENLFPLTLQEKYYK